MKPFKTTFTLLLIIYIFLCSPFWLLFGHQARVESNAQQSPKASLKENMHAQPVACKFSHGQDIKLAQLGGKLWNWQLCTGHNGTEMTQLLSFTETFA